MKLRLVAVFLLVAASATPVLAQVDDSAYPILHEETTRGSILKTPPTDSVVASKTVDGDISDWTGTATGFGGTTVLSKGERIYTDHLFDAYGADDGRDAEREPIYGAHYRFEALHREDPPSQLGADTPAQLAATEQIGDQGLTDRADISEVRIAADATNLYLLVRTTTMKDVNDAAALVLINDPTTSTALVPGFNSGLDSVDANQAFFFANGTANTTVNASGWTNAIEASIPRGSLPSSFSISVATGLRNADGTGFADLPGDGPNVANIAFRDEPVRVWFDRSQGVALHDRTVPQEFFQDVNLGQLTAGANQNFTLLPGYHDRIFTSSEDISTEGGQDGILQHYGLYVPRIPPGGALPLQFWLHWRGGKAHSAAATSPRIMRDFGDERGFVVSPRGRGTSQWYHGKGHIDVLEVYGDVHNLLGNRIDPNRRYLSGHSMGGWGSWLFAILYPDKFAAALPVAGPVTQGAFTGADFEGCDEFTFDDYSPCYIAANGSNPRVQHNLRMLGNLRNTPVGIFHGALDELVPVSGVTRNAAELRELGYEFEYFLFPTYEHFGHPINDEWAEGVRYLDQHSRVEIPRRVTYKRDMPFERSVERGPNQQSAAVRDFKFDSAWWMKELTPSNLVDGVATFDGETFGVSKVITKTLPVAGGPASPGQAGPYVMVGQELWPTGEVEIPLFANKTVFDVFGASSVMIDAKAAGQSVDPSMGLEIRCDDLQTVKVQGDFGSAARNVIVNGNSTPITAIADVLSIPLGTSCSSDLVVVQILRT